MNKKKTPSAAPSATVNAKKSVKKRKSRKKAAKKQLTEQQKEQNIQQKEIRGLMTNMGFSRVPHVDGTEFVYDGRTSELDDIFYQENIVLFVEYTVGAGGDHLLKKKIIYDKINEDHKQFIDFLLGSDLFKPLKETFQRNILSKYSVKQLQLRILYASKKGLAKEHKNLAKGVHYFDYSIVKYFESISKIIRLSAKYEFLHFLGIDYSNFGENIKSSTLKNDDIFSGHILPEEQSSFKDGYKIVSFYIDAASLMRRAYVLRKDGWRNNDSMGLYQRMFLAKKIRSMRKYLHEHKRVFINNIIVTLPTDKIKLTDENGDNLKIDSKGNIKGGGRTTVTPTGIIIENTANIIGIVDGQHRSYAYHEGNDAYEKTIAGLRKVQNLLVTGILYPKDEIEERKLKFEAQLFLEINSNQSRASSQLKQEIEFMMNPFSTVSVCKYIINDLNESGPLATMLEQFWFEKAKIKTTTIISFGLKPLVKFDGQDTLFRIWKHSKKANLKSKKDDFDVLKAYKQFCAQQVKYIFIGLKQNIEKSNWTMDRNNSNAILNVTTINGVINCLRLLIENDIYGDIDYYKEKFASIEGFKFKKYKSSQYRKMGKDIFDRCFS